MLCKTYEIPIVLIINLIGVFKLDQNLVPWQYTSASKEMHANEMEILYVCTYSNPTSDFKGVHRYHQRRCVIAL